MMKIIYVIFALSFVMCDLTFGKKAKGPAQMNRKQKFDYLFKTVADMQNNVSALWMKMQEMSQMETRASGGVNIYSHDGHVQHVHHDEDDGQHLHMHMHIDSGCEHREHDEDGEMHERTHVHAHNQEFVHGHCEVKPNSQLPDGVTSTITGHIHLKQRAHGGPLHIDVHLGGFDVSGEHAHHVHGFHVHEFGDLSNGCNSLGGHYSTHAHSHGAPDADERHTGDWGNIMCNDEGIVDKHFTDRMASLIGTDSIIGRSIVIHRHADDMGLNESPASKSSGDAGPRIACCVIGRSMAHNMTHAMDGNGNGETTTEDENHEHHEGHDHERH